MGRGCEWSFLWRGAVQRGGGRQMKGLGTSAAAATGRAHLADEPRHLLGGHAHGAALRHFLGAERAARGRGNQAWAAPAAGSPSHCPIWHAPPCPATRRVPALLPTRTRDLPPPTCGRCFVRSTRSTTRSSYTHSLVDCRGRGRGVLQVATRRSNKARVPSTVRAPPCRTRTRRRDAPPPPTAARTCASAWQMASLTWWSAAWRRLMVMLSLDIEGCSWTEYTNVNCVGM
jgi:hypothetical protein